MTYMDHSRESSGRTGQPLQRMFQMVRHPVCYVIEVKILFDCYIFLLCRIHVKKFALFSALVS